MTREVVNQTPTRKTLVTGESLPAVDTSSRPIPLGRDEDGEPDAQVRAFAVLARNRSDSAVYVREGPSDDENAIDPGESFQIWEPNGISDVQIRGEEGGERVEFRTLEAHNDFSITDKIDAFSRALSHFFGTSRRSTTIEGDVTVGTINDGINVDSVAGDISVGSLPSVDIATINDGISVEGDVSVTGGVDANITNSSLLVDSVTGGIEASILGNVAIGTINDGIDVDSLPSVDIQTINDGISVDNGNITVDDITAANASFDGDITGQTDFDLSMFQREGRTEIESFDDFLSAGTEGQNFGEVIPDYHHADIRTNAAYDGRIERVEIRLYDYDRVEDLGFKVRIDYESDGSYVDVSPRACNSAVLAHEIGGGEIEVVRYYPGGEIVYVWEPNQPITYEAGDTVGIEVGPLGNTLAGTGSYAVEAEIRVTDMVVQESI